MGLGESDRIGTHRWSTRATRDRVYVARWASSTPPAAQRGVYRTTDGGATWQQVLDPEAMTGPASSIW